MLSASANSDVCCRYSSRLPFSRVDVVLRRRGHELLQVLDPALGLDRPLRVERIQIARLVQQRVEQLGDGTVLGGLGLERLHRVHEARERVARRLRQTGHLTPRRFPHVDPEVVRVPEHARHRGLSDATLGRVRDPREGRRVPRVDEERQVRDRVLDLRPLVELRAADHLVGDAGAREHLVEHPRLRVRAVEDGDLGAGHALVHEPLDLGRDPARLGVLVGHLPHAHRVAVPQVRPQVLGHLPAVVGDQRVRGVQDRLRGAVVLLQLDDVRVRVVLFELQDVPDVRRPEAVDRLWVTSPPAMKLCVSSTLMS